MTALLEVENVGKRFGGVQAVRRNSASRVDEGEILGLIGPNGAGKSTVFNLINGVFAAEPGGSFSTASTSPARRPIASRGSASRARTRSCSRSST